MCTPPLLPPHASTTSEWKWQGLTTLLPDHYRETIPSYIADTGIVTQRDAIKEKEANMLLKAKTRECVQPKMGKIDIDYQKLHDAFFKFQTKLDTPRNNPSPVLHTFIKLMLLTHVRLAWLT
jgi:hypothetical protein